MWLVNSFRGAAEAQISAKLLSLHTALWLQIQTEATTCVSALMLSLALYGPKTVDLLVPLAKTVHREPAVCS